MRGATAAQGVGLAAEGISIHAPREGRDAGQICAAERYIISIHAPREGRDFRRAPKLYNAGNISIHAPREGRDLLALHLYMA